MMNTMPAAATPKACARDAVRRLLEQLERLHDADLSELDGELGRAQSLLRGAVNSLLDSFESLNQDTKDQQSTVDALFSEGSGEEGPDEALSVRAFVKQSSARLRLLSDELSLLCARGPSLDEGHDAMRQAIDRLLLPCQEKASEHGFEADLDEARTQLKALCAKASTEASLDVARAQNAKQEVDSMLDELDSINAKLSTQLAALSGFRARVHESAASAVRSLQFEDIITQILGHVSHRLQNIPAVFQEARQSLPSGAFAQMSEGEYIEALCEAFIQARNQARPPKAVEQDTMDAGEIELF